MASANAPNETTASADLINIPPGEEAFCSASVVGFGNGAPSDTTAKLRFHMPKGHGEEAFRLASAMRSGNGAPNDTTTSARLIEMPKGLGEEAFWSASVMGSGTGAPNDTTASVELNTEMPKGLAERKIDILHESALWWPECCIYEVPQSLRKEENSVAYTPQFVSIGPIHHKKENLKWMEKHKEKYRICFERRLLNRKASMYAYKAYLEGKEEYIRICYSKKYDDLIFDHKDKEENQFVNMILLDAIFTMELFLRTVNNLDGESDLRLRPWVMAGVNRDLLLLENQLPMFVLVELYNNFVPDFLKGKEHYSFHELAYKYFFNPQDPIPKDLPRVFQQSKHFTDMLRYTQLPRDYQQLKPSKSECFHLLKTAIKLDEAGITFEKQEKYQGIEFKKKDFLNIFPFLSMIPWINLFKARFRIPQLCIDDTTEVHFRNIIALEQCHYPYQQYISSYIALLDRLIDTREDAHFLMNKKIIHHTLGNNKEVATLLNNLLKEVCISCEFYGDEIRRIHEH